MEEFAWRKVSEHESLSKLFSDRPSQFAICPATILFLWSLVNRRMPRRILEFGGGTSTAIFGEYARQMRDKNCQVEILSIDHDSGWLEDTRARLKRSGSDEFVTLVHAPVSQQNLLGRNLQAYSLAREVLTASAGAEGFDLCFIDGPPRDIGRAGGLALAAPHLAKDAIVLLDDAFRAAEQAILREWSAHWADGMTRVSLLSASHGVGMFRWRHREESCVRGGE
jgi:predicted O-methyltransferase YrrM